MTCQAGLIEMARPDRRVTHGKRARRRESRVNNQPALTPFGRPDTPTRRRGARRTSRSWIDRSDCSSRTVVNRAEGADFAMGQGPRFSPDTLPPVPEQPTRDDALAAPARLAYPVRGFPFVGDESTSVAQEQSTFDC